MKTAKLLLSSILTIAAALTTQAQSELFNWSFITASGVDGSGTLTVNAGQLVENGDDTYSGYLVTSISGTYQGQNINSLAPVGYVGGWQGYNDNLLTSLISSSEQLSSGGIAFYMGSIDVTPENFSFSQHLSAEDDYQDCNTIYGNAEFGSFTADIAPVPEPSTVALSVAGVALLLLSRRIVRPPTMP
jgi:hypothetical protein